MGRLGKARIILEEALTLVRKFPSIKSSGVTYMNICAVVSQAGLHEKALAYARQGLIECEHQLAECLDSRGAAPHGGEEGGDSFERRSLLEERVKFTAISYHNIGIEEEHFKNFEQAKEAFKASFMLYEDYQLSQSDHLFSKFKQSYLRCLQVS